jgi:hypothetical protein
MDIDFMQQKEKYRGKKNAFKRPKNKKGYNQASEPPKLYDKHGNPVCGYCQGRHRNYECRQNTNGKNNKYEVAQVESETKNNTDLVELQSIEAKQVNNITYSKSVTPTIVIKFGSNSIIALWDTGSAITAINEEVANKLKLKIHKTDVIQYIDVNNVHKNTVGSVKLALIKQSSSMSFLD